MNEKTLNIRGMQIETTMRDHLTHVRNNKCWQGCGKRNPHTLPVGVEIGAREKMFNVIAIRETQTETTVKYNCTPIKTVLKLKNSDDAKCG